MLKTSTLFKYNYSATAHVVVNQGGTSSGKTYAVEQVLFCLACSQPKSVITIVGQDIPNLKSGALRDALSIYSGSAELQKLVKNYNRTLGWPTAGSIVLFLIGITWEAAMLFSSFMNAQHDLQRQLSIISRRDSLYFSKIDEQSQQIEAIKQHQYHIDSLLAINNISPILKRPLMNSKTDN